MAGRNDASLVCGEVAALAGPLPHHEVHRALDPEGDDRHEVRAAVRPHRGQPVRLGGRGVGQPLFAPAPSAARDRSVLGARSVFIAELSHRATAERIRRGSTFSRITGASQVMRRCWASPRWSDPPSSDRVLIVTVGLEAQGGDERAVAVRRGCASTAEATSSATEPRATSPCRCLPAGAQALGRGLADFPSPRETCGPREQQWRPRDGADQPHDPIGRGSDPGRACGGRAKRDVRQRPCCA